MGIDWTHLLAEQLDRHWRRRLRPRYDGPTDAEYFWEPVANTWNIHPRGHGRAAMAAGGGEFVIDFADPEPGTSHHDRVAARASDHRRVRHPGRRPLRRPTQWTTRHSTMPGRQGRHCGSSMTCTPHG